jgi:CDP-4-dehydro-6-deoxyglucose reductase
MATFKVHVQPAGREFSVADGQALLAAALDAGITLPYGCKDGTCGSCKGRVVAGRVLQGPHAAAALTPQEEAAGLALFCCASAQSDLIIEVRSGASPDLAAARRMPARIERIERPAADIAIVWLKLAAGEQLPFRAGQYVDVLLAGGARRSYSIASMPGTEGPLEFHIRHMPGGMFTDALFGATPTVKERGILRIEGPHGSFQLHEDAGGPIVLLAGGTGFAPLKSIAETIFAKGYNRDDPATGRRARPVVLYWGARTFADLYRHDLPSRWEREQPNFRYVPVLSEPGAGDGAGGGAAGEIARGPDWTGRTGLVHRAVMHDLPDLSAWQVYACGVPAMVHAARRDFIAQCGLKEENFFSDAFTSRADLPSAATL